MTILISILLAFGVVLGAAYIVYKQGNASLAKQATATTALEKIAEAQVEQLAPISAAGALNMPTVKKGGILNRHRLNLLNYSVLLAPIMDLLNSDVIESYTLQGVEEDQVNAKDNQYHRVTQKESLYEVIYKGTPLLLVFTAKSVKTDKIIVENYKLPEEEETLVGYDFSCNLPLSEDPVVSQNMVEFYELLMDVLKGAVISIDNSTGGRLDSIYRVTMSGPIADLDQMMGKTIVPLPKALINASYAPCAELVVGGKAYRNVPMASRIEQEFRPAIQDGKNIAILGRTGEGKTELINAIVAELEGFNLLFLNQDTLHQVVKSPTLLSRAADGGKLVVVFDEAQDLDPDSLKALLQLMEGNQKVQDVSFILGLNSTSPDPALVRPGRVDYLINLEQLSKTAARNVCKVYTDTHPEFQTDLHSLNVLLLPEPATFTLAQVYSCIKPKGRVAEVQKAYQMFEVGKK